MRVAAADRSLCFDCVAGGSSYALRLAHGLIVLVFCAAVLASLHAMADQAWYLWVMPLCHTEVCLPASPMQLGIG